MTWPFYLFESCYLYTIYIHRHRCYTVIHILAHKLTHMIDIHMQQQYASWWYNRQWWEHGWNPVVSQDSCGFPRRRHMPLRLNGGDWFSISRTCGNVGSLAHGEMMWDALLLLRLTPERLRMMWEWFATFFCSPWEGESAQKHPPAIVRSLAKHKAQNGKEICDL